MNFNDLLSPFDLSVSTLTDSSPKAISLAVENRILEGVRMKTSLSTVPLTGSFWKPSPHLSEGLWSCMITRFRCQSVGLGNRTNIYKNYAEHNDEGRVVQCPLCLMYKNNEIHILVQCVALKSARNSKLVGYNTSISTILSSLKKKYPLANATTLARLFLGQEPNLRKFDYIVRGKLLISLVGAFFECWAKICSRPLPIPTG